MDALSRLDLALCIDVTGSMSPFIQAARSQMAGVLDALREALGEGLRVAVVGYRDHGDKPLLEVQPFTAELGKVREVLGKLTPSGGGDAPEAVYSGLEACLGLPWGEGAYRVVVLVGDAPPHACGAQGDRHPRLDPSGYDLDGMANRLEEEGVFVHALAMTPRADAVLERSFQRLSISTGGTFHDARDGQGAMALVQAVSQRFLADLDFDRRLFDALRAGVVEAHRTPPGEEPPPRAAILAGALGRSVDDVYGGLMRLRQRRLS